MNLLAPETVPAAAGTCYRFVVESAEQAATLIRERLGANARVLSVRSVEGSGWRRLISSPKLEVIAQIDAPAPVAPPANVEITGDATAAVSTAPSRRLRPDTFRSLPELLRHSGFSENILRRLEAAPNWGELSTAPLHRAFVEVGRNFAPKAHPGPSVRR